VTDQEIDDILHRAAGSPREVPAQLLERIADSIAPSLRPVRPLPPNWVLSGALGLIGGAVALIGAARVGFQGFQSLGFLSRVLILSALALFIWASARRAVDEWTPGSPRHLSNGGLVAAFSVALAVVFGLLFDDYRTENFVSAGLTCLCTGVLHAIPAALLAWWVLRGGCALDSVSAGLAVGALAGLAGLAVLELHCANFEAMHVLVWHTLVVPVSAGCGALIGWALRHKAR
jgi:hypothetical protein